MLTRRSLVLPLILIGIGAVALLANLGVLSADAIDRTVSLWPLVLVLAGAELIVHRVLPPASATVAGLALLGLMLVVVVSYAALGPRVPGGSRSIDGTAPARTSAAPTWCWVCIPRHTRPGEPAAHWDARVGGRRQSRHASDRSQGQDPA